jgi:creatinine amidohydrolase/Fe(II)-dependent formamide hydrolase-like protein
MLHLAPELVDMSKALDEPVSQECSPPSGIFWSTWARQETVSGIYGRPSVASAENGKVFFQTLVEKVSEFLAKYYRHDASRPGAKRKKK